MTIVFDLLLDIVLDSLRTLPFLFAAYLFIEYTEHKATDRFVSRIAGAKKFSLPLASAFGLVPQCGFLVSAVKLFTGGLISLGALTAIFISTSDDAFPVLLGSPDGIKTIAVLMGIKFAVAVTAGFLVGKFVSETRISDPGAEHDSLHSHCGDDCCEHGIFLPALKHTLLSWLFILLSMVAFGFAVHYIGEDAIGSIFMTNSLLQPLIAALIGLIPGCAPSIILSELYLSSAVSFGSLAAGLVSCSGVGLVFLFRSNRNVKQNIFMTGLLFVLGSALGIILQFTGISV